MLLPSKVHDYTHSMYCTLYVQACTKEVKRRDVRRASCHDVT